MKQQTLKLELKWDNGRVTAFGRISYETSVTIQTLADELFRGNAVELRLNDGMWLSYPEKHSGEHKHVADATADAPLATKKA